MAPHEGSCLRCRRHRRKHRRRHAEPPGDVHVTAVLGSLVLDVAGNRLDATFLDSTGVRRDYFSILKGAGGVDATDASLRWNARSDPGQV